MMYYNVHAVGLLIFNPQLQSRIF